MKLNGTLLKSTVIAALVAAPMAPVMAQTAETDGATEQTAPATEAANFSEAELSSFIDAAMQVQAVQQDYMTRIQETEADEDKQALVQEAQAEEVHVGAVQVGLQGGLHYCCCCHAGQHHDRTSKSASHLSAIPGTV